MSVISFGLISSKEKKKSSNLKSLTLFKTNKQTKKPFKNPLAGFVAFAGGGRDYPKVRDFSSFEAVLV